MFFFGKNMSDVLSKYIRDDFQKVLSQYFKPALEYTKSALSSYEYKVYQVSEGECVFLIEDVFALYVGIVDFTFTIRAPKYTVLFEELLFNPFPNLKHTLLRKDLYSFLKVGEFDLTVQSSFHFAPFRGFWNSTVKETPEFAVYSIGKENINYSNLKIQSRKQHVEESLPELQLRARFDSWEGYHYLFVVYELEYNGQVGHAVFCVRDKKNLKIHNEARKKVADLEWSAIETLANRNRGKTSSIISVKQENSVQLPKDGLLFDDLMIDAIIESRKSDSATVGKDYFKLSNVLKYYYIHGYVKDEFENKRDELLANYFRNDVGNLIRKQQEILKQAIANEYADEQRYTFLVSGNKWKSEQMVLELTRKLYPQ